MNFRAFVAVVLLTVAAICRGDIEFDPKPTVLNQGDSDPVGARFNADGTQCLFEFDEAVRVIHLGRAAPPGLPIELHRRIRCAAFLPEANRVFAVLADGAVCAWDSSTGKEAHKPLQIGRPVSAAALTHDGKRCVIGCADGTILSIDLAAWRISGKPLRQWGPVHGIGISADDENLVASHFSHDEFPGSIGVWNMRLQTRIYSKEPRDGVNAAAISHDGKRILIGGDSANVATVWDLQGQQICQTAPVFGHIDRVAFNHADSQFYIAFDTGLRIFDAATGKPVTAALGDKISTISQAQFSPDDRWIFGVGAAGCACLWNIKTSQSQFCLSGCSSYRFAQFSPDGKTVAVGCGDNHSIGIWTLP